MFRRISRRKVLAGAAVAAAPVALTTGLGQAMGATNVMQRNGFDRERFVADCALAVREGGQAAVKDVLARAVADSKAVLTAMGEPQKAGLDVLHRSPALTIFAAKWTPRMYLLPHDHLMWALIGIYTGREDNILWHRAGSRIEARDVRTLFAGDVAVLPADVIHSVTNPLERFTGGLHIYGGDFFATARSQWNAETLAEERSDGETIRAMFDHENERLRR